MPDSTPSSPASLINATPRPLQYVITTLNIICDRTQRQTCSQVKLISQRANELIPLLESVFAEANETDDTFLHRLNELLRVVLGAVYDEERIGNLPAVAQAQAEGDLEDVNSALAGLVDALRRVSSEPKDRSNVFDQALEALDSARSKLLATITTPQPCDVSSPKSHISPRNSDITPGTGLDVPR
jgi:hypothetical protein